MQDNTLYDVLGIAPDANHEQVRQAFLRLAYKYHPDLSNGDANEERFKQLRYAYEILSNAERRSIYDLSLDSYATSIRQSHATEVDAKGKSKRNWRPAASTITFQTQWLTDRARTRERWMFASFVLLTIGLVVAVSNYLRLLQTTFEQSIHLDDVVANSVAANEAGIPTNALPKISPDFRKHFKEEKSVADENVDRSNSERLVDENPEPVAQLQLDSPSVTKTRREDWTFVAETVFSQTLSAFDSYPKPAGLPSLSEVRPNQPQNLHDTDDVMPAVRVPTAEFELATKPPPSPIYFVPSWSVPPAPALTTRIETRRDFWDGSDRFRKSAVPLFRDRTPSQAELTNAMRTNNFATPTSQHLDTHSTRTSLPSSSVPGTFSNPINQFPQAPPAFEPPTVPQFVPPAAPQFAPPPGPTNGIYHYGNL